MLGLGTIKICARSLESDTEEEDEGVEDIVTEDPRNKRNQEVEDDEDINTVASHVVTDGPPRSLSHSFGITSSEDERQADFQLEEDEESGGREGGCIDLNISLCSYGHHQPGKC